MRRNWTKRLLVGVFCAAAGAAEPVALPLPLVDAPILDMPSGHGGISQTGPGPEPMSVSSGTGSVLSSLLSSLLAWPAEAVLGAPAPEWRDLRELVERELSSKEFDYFYASRVKCPAPKCIVFGGGGFMWLITADENLRVVDAELVAGSQREEIPENERTGIQRVRRVAILDTPFGRAGKYGNEFIDFASTGFFCSYYHNDREPTRSTSYKRLVSPDGTITSKQIDRWDDCRLPW